MTSSLEKPLAENQRIIYQARLHWAILLGPVLVIFIGWLTLESKGPPAVILIAFGFIWGIFSYLNLRQSDILLTNNHLFIKIGFPLKRSYTIPLDTLTQVKYYQPSLGGLLNFGKIMLIHSGTKKHVFRFIARPALLVKEVQETLMPPHQYEQ